MQIQKINTYQNQRNNSQQAFGMKIDLRQLPKTKTLKEFSYVSKGFKKTYVRTPKSVKAAILSCKSAIARIKPLDGTIVFHRSSYTTKFNHLEVELGGVYRTVTDDIFDNSKNLGKAIMKKVRELSKEFKESRNRVYKIHGRIRHIPTNPIVEALRDLVDSVGKNGTPVKKKGIKKSCK